MLEEVPVRSLKGAGSGKPDRPELWSWEDFWYLGTNSGGNAARAPSSRFHLKNSWSTTPSPTRVLSSDRSP